MVRVRGLVFCNSGEPIRVGGMGGDSGCGSGSRRRWRERCERKEVHGAGESGLKGTGLDSLGGRASLKAAADEEEDMFRAVRGSGRHISSLQYIYLRAVDRGGWKTRWAPLTPGARALG